MFFMHPTKSYNWNEGIILFDFWVWKKMTITFGEGYMHNYMAALTVSAPFRRAPMNVIFPISAVVIFNQTQGQLRILCVQFQAQAPLSLLFVKLEELHIVTARKPLIHQNQPVAQYLHKIQPCML